VLWVKLSWHYLTGRTFFYPLGRPVRRKFDKEKALVLWSTVIRPSVILFPRA
jgi:hypothetical protein